MANETETDQGVPSAETAIFRIGGQDIHVPPLMFKALKAAKTEILSLGPGLDFITYSETVLRILAEAIKPVRPDLTFEVLEDQCSAVEMRELAQSMNQLLEISGFRVGETPAAGEAPSGAQTSGTGTSTPSSQNSQDTTSAQGTSNGLSGAIH